jgi:hypothetical protein
LRGPRRPSKSSSPSSSPLPPGMSLPEAERTLRREGYGDEEPRSEGEQFVSECLDWVGRWFKEHRENPALEGVAPFVFVFDSTRQTQTVFPGGKSLPSFRNDLSIQIGGKAYAVAANLRNAYAASASVGAKTCPELLSFLSESNLTHTFAVAVSPLDRSAMVHFADDIDAASFVSFKRVSAGNFDFRQLDSVLAFFYTHYVSTHEGHCDVWAKATKRHLKSQPERQIQRSLHGFFRHAVLPTSAFADSEVRTYAGRTDLRILRARDDRSLEGAVLELKVLFGHKSDQDNLTWAKEGVDQAVRYSTEDARIVVRYVCCYDGRKKDSAMPEGVAYALEKAVTWRRYFMQTPGCSATISDCGS